MGERVTQSGRAELARASRLKKALESGAPPAFVPPVSPAHGQLGNGQWGNGQPGNVHSGNGASPANGACSEQSCPLPPLLEPPPKKQQSAEIRLQLPEQMFQASPDGLSIADSSHRILLANETFVRMFEYESAEVVGQPLEDLVVPPDRIAESRWVTEALAKGQRITLETQRRKKDGTLLDVSVSCAPLLLDGKMAGYYAGYHDISDRKRVEALSSALYRVAEKSSSAHDLQQFFAAVHGIVDELMY